ncbi:hypothetical protein KJR58_24245, partial [Escherichia coli]
GLTRIQPFFLFFFFVYFIVLSIELIFYVIICFFSDTATNRFYTGVSVGRVKCVKETEFDQRRGDKGAACHSRASSLFSRTAWNTGRPLLRMV